MVPNNSAEDELTLAGKIERVRLNKADDPIDQSDEDIVESSAVSVEEVDPVLLTSSSAITISNSERALAAHFSSPAADFLKSRDFQGLDFSVPNDARVEIVTGCFGTASSGYVIMKDSDNEDQVSSSKVTEKVVVTSIPSLNVDSSSTDTISNSKEQNNL